MADVITGNTQLGASKQDVIAAIVQRELKFGAKLLPSVTDVSQFAIKGAKSISFPKLTSFTVIDRATATQGDASVLTSSVDKLDLDINAYVAWIIDSSDAVQTTFAAEAEFAKYAAAAHSRYVDTQIYTGLETYGVATTTAGDITRNIVLEMREALLSRQADPNALTLVVSPDQETALLKVDEFTRAEVYGSSVIPNGMIGKVYGVPVILHTGLAADKYYMYEKGGLAIGFQLGPQMSEQGANEYGSQAKRVAMDQLFGIKGLQLGVNGVGAAESALIVKDNN